MSVYTPVSAAALRSWLQGYPVGALLATQAIATGITNSNYFVTTHAGQFVLTLFEHKTVAEVAGYLALMAHLAAQGIPCPQPQASRSGEYCLSLRGKPAALLTRLPGRALETPSAAECAKLGAMLARLHAAGRSFLPPLPNVRGDAWRQSMTAALQPLLDAHRRALLLRELAFQQTLAWERLPTGVIHGDLFRDNVLFAGDEVSGVLDFEFACHDALAYDLAIAVNDWCVAADGQFDAARAQALLAAYHAERPLTSAEQQAWPGLLRAAALRFWLSRLYDSHYPRSGELTTAKNPEHFQRMLELRATDLTAPPWAWNGANA